MRLTSEMVVSALTRRIFADGGFAAVERRGADAAGAIFIRHRHRDGTETLYAPAPQSFLEDTPDRQFEPRLKGVAPEEVDALLAREMKWDADIWVVEIETDEAGKYFAVVGE
jgi:hypothetical protein